MILRPFVEELDTNRIDTKLERHSRIAASIVSGLVQAKKSSAARELLQNRLVDFIRLDKYYERVLLYLPFYALEEPVPLLRYQLRHAWPHFLKTYDVRENFNLGDARHYADEVPERVVKIVHLLPWLLKNGFLEQEDVFSTLASAEFTKNEILGRSLADVLPCLKKWGILEPGLVQQAEDFLTWLPPRPTRSEPGQDNEAYWAWQRERASAPRVHLENLTGPFSWNLDDIGLAKAESMLDGTNIIRIGGSRLKGYAREGSDYDFYPLAIGAEPDPDPEEIHLFFNTVWVGESKEILRAERDRHAKAYMAVLRGSDRRRRCMEKLEQDLLLYRLMHKGFPYAYPEDLSLATRDFPEMDGASAFYDDRYRQVATELFVRFVQLPQAW